MLNTVSNFHGLLGLWKNSLTGKYQIISKKECINTFMHPKIV